jgi:alkylation response protein AidB-like acyl-CoA dehydrogenase
MKVRVAGPCLRGDKRISLCVSEATAGSDVGSMKTTATLEGDTYETVYNL